jgi:lactoylglutathione lyase
MKQNIAEFTDQFGIILFVEKFHECEKFYAKTIGLRISYRAKLLTRFEFGDGYLMLEGEDNDSRKGERGSFVIRFNVGDLVGATEYLRQREIDLVTHDFDWGSITVFTDPDGNRCELVKYPAR